MNPATQTFLRQRFLEYYSGARIIMPPSLPEREWGFIVPGDSGGSHMRRHMAFSDASQLQGYIKGLVPFHIYYSVAYYQNPGGPTMADKGWLGADLIFDLDADHIVRGDFAMMLRRVKEETEKLLAMLTGELGISRSAIDVVFSGGRGYHVHVRDIAFRSYGSAERREIIDYVCGTGLDPAIMSGRSGPPDSWGARFQISVQEYVTYLHSLPGDGGIKELAAYEGIGALTAERFMKLAALETQGQGGVTFQPANREVMTVLRTLLKDPGSGLVRLIREKAALADEPVTTDTKRLIRMPSSLHGGSGLRVTPLSPSELAGFDPLVDAVVFGEREIRVDLQRPVTLSLLGSEYHCEKGIVPVPEAVAVFLCCRGMAEIAG